MGKKQNKNKDMVRKLQNIITESLGISMVSILHTVAFQRLLLMTYYQTSQSCIMSQKYFTKHRRDHKFYPKQRRALPGVTIQRDGCYASII